MIIIELFVYLGIIAAGISGAIIGIKKELDLFGVLCLCAVTSLGGGIIRDLMIGNVPPLAFITPYYFMASLIAGLLVWIFYKFVRKLSNVIMISDAIGLGVFTAVGSTTALMYNITEPFIVLSMGLITGIGGGVLRDVFAREIPYVFRKEIYAIASILGSVSLLLTYNFSPVLAMYTCLFVTFSVRMLSVYFKLNFPVMKVSDEGVVEADVPNHATSHTTNKGSTT